MNAIELLKADHEVVAALFAKVKSGKASEYPTIFKKIKAELDAHTHIEETIFYPKLKAEGKSELTDITLEGIEEHHQVKMFLKELAGLSGSSEKFEPKLTVLIEDVEHHVKEEEETMFPLVKKSFSTAALDDLGDLMEKAKKEFQNSSAAKAA